MQPRKDGGPAGLPCAGRDALHILSLIHIFLAADEMPDFTFTWYATHWGYFALGISLVVVCVLAVVYLKASKASHAWRCV